MNAAFPINAAGVSAKTGAPGTITGGTGGMTGGTGGMTGGTGAFAAILLVATMVSF